MKIGFFGTPEIAAFCLDKLSEKFEISFVVTCEDKARGRNQKVCCTEVKNMAISKEIPVIQPSTLKNEAVIKQINSYNADIYVVVAYGFIIPEAIFDFPRLKTINLHPSMLPKYRGAAPIQWAIVKGEKETGITIQQVNEKLDAGDIVLQRKMSLDNNINSCELYEKVLPIGAEMLIEAINGLDKGTLELNKQDENKVIYCGKIGKDTAHINWTESKETIHNLVRGLNPKPVAWSTFRSKNIKIWQTIIPIDEDLPELQVAEITKFKKKRLLVGTANGILEILQIQPENKKMMDATAFINGSRLEAGEKFE